MRLTLITSAPALAAELGRQAREAGMEVAETLVRRQDEALAPLLGRARGDLVVAGVADAEADLAGLEALATHRPLPPLVLLSVRRDTDTLLRAMRAGVHEVLADPPPAAEFLEALRRAAQRVPARSVEPPRGRVVAFVASKGGSGATFLATNLGHLLATECHRRVVLLDLDLQYGDAAYFVSDQPVRTSIADLARQAERLDASMLDAALLRVAPGFGVLPAPEEPEAALGLTAQQLEQVIRVAREQHDFVLLDVQRLLDPLTLKALDQADTVCLVTHNMIPHVRDARRLVRILRALGYADSKLQLLVNRHSRRAGLPIEQVEKAVGLKVDRVLPDGGDDVADAVNAGVPVSELHPHHTITRALRELAAGLCDGPHAGPRGWLDRLFHEAA